MKLFLLDAYALIFRAYYALIRVPRLTTGGQNTSAVFGFVSTLEEVLRKENPTHIAICFDPAGPTFRHEAYENYKGEREATPEDIKWAVPVIKEIAAAYNIPVVEVPGFEADDVIGTLSKQADAKGYTTYMMTPDKDFGQLVSENVLQYKPSYRGQDFEIRGVKKVCEKYGIQSPLQVIDLLALMGDKIDCIPGCPGVGEKTAVKLIGEFGSVENLLQHTQDIKGALRKKVEENAEQINFSKFLATIRTDVPVDINVDELQRKEPDTEALFAIFDRLEFRALKERVAKRLGIAAEPAPAKPAAPQQLSLFDFDDFIPRAEGRHPNNTPREAAIAPIAPIIPILPTEVKELHRLLEDAKCVGIQMVGDGESDMTARWVGTAIALPDGRAYYLPCSLEGAEELVLELLRREDITKCTYDAKRDYVLAFRASDSQEPVRNYYDVSVAHYLTAPEAKHTPEIICGSLLPNMTIPTDPTADSKKLTYAGALPEALMPWACAIAYSAVLLKPVVDKGLQEIGLENMLHEMELPLTRVLAEMEIAGVRIDVEALNAASTEMLERILTLEEEICTLAGEQFNVGSPSQVGEILFGKMQLDPKAKRTKSGQFSTSEDVLEKVAHLNPIVGKILKYRQLKKLRNTYLEALPAAINPITGKIHTTYNQTVTATGRLSSTDPNLQNIPVRDDEGRDIRRAFIPDPGHLFLSADYSQIELRLMADFSGDETMLDAFRHGRDIHAITASKIYHEPLEDVTQTQRRNAKTANFGIIYGISAFGLSQRLGIPRAEAKMLIDGYFKTFPAVSRYMDDAIQKAKEQGYVTTIHGRRRPLPDINSRNPVVRGYAERNAINAPLQGSAADIIKIAMVRIANDIRRRGLKSKMIMQVHDELNFDVVPEELPELQQLVSECMEGAYQGRVTLTASSGVADNWLDAH